MSGGWYRPLIDPALPEPDARVPWRPNGCEVSCLRVEDPRTVSLPVQLARLIALGACFAATLCVAAIAPTAGRLAQWAARTGSRAALRAIGVTVQAAPPSPPTLSRHPRSGSDAGVLVVSNHVSWLDILVVQAAYGPMRMLAMKELASWPVLSWLARRVGTVFIDRDRLLALPGTVADLATALRAGGTMAAFPEGATTCGRHPLVWRNAVFQAALDADADVLVLGLSYRAGGARTGYAALLRRERAWSSLRRVLKLHRLSAELECAWLPQAELPPTRRALATEAGAVAAKLVGSS